MPHINELKKSSFLKKEDCGPNGILVTIKEITQENVAREGAPEELKWCMFFVEGDKPMVLNSTNIQLLASICGSPQTEDWIGKRVVLYNDPSISFQGKMTGGIRVRAPKGKAANAAPAKAQAPAPAPAAVEEEVDDVPF